MRANSTQKAYDEAFLACSTAVYFESQSNEPEALRAWKTALDHIYYHNAHRGPALLRPSSETDRALVDSLRQLELQCKERVDLLETLKRSRDEAPDKPPSPPPRGTPPAIADTNSSSSWLGGGTVPPVEYAHLTRPPLPARPSLPHRKSSGASTRTLTPTTTASLSAPTAALSKKESRTPSPEKRGRMLRTLRPGRDNKSSSSSKLQTSLRTRPPDAAKAATQAWTFNPNASSSRLTKVSSATLQPISSRSSLERSNLSLESPTPTLPDQNPDPYQPQPPLYFRHLDGSEPEYSKAQRPVRNDVASPPAQSQSLDVNPLKNSSANGAILPSYRNEYPVPPVNSRVLAASAAARPLSEPDSSNSTLPATAREGDRIRRPMKEQPEPISLEVDDNERKTRPPPRRKAKTKEDTARADLPPTPSSDTANSENSEDESDEWKERVRGILKNLPRGVDEAAARQILNEIVIHGDEVHWSDVAGLDVAKSALKENVVYPFLRPDLFMGLREPARGMLLFGPPGTGKTMLARAVATESNSTFFAISASSLTSKFLGESEKLVRALFALAKLLAPSIIFVDEIDSLLSSRSGSGEHEATRRIKTEFLIQWSDLAKAAAGKEQTDKDKEKGDATRVLVLAATNLPWAIDEAARRRFVRRQYIPLPEDHVRKSQVKTLLSHQKHELSEPDLDHLVQLTDGTFHVAFAVIDERSAHIH